MARLLRWDGMCSLLPIVCLTKPRMAGDFILCRSFYLGGYSTSPAWVQNEDRFVERKTVCVELGMQTHAQIRHNPNNPAAALGSQAYCVFLKLYLTVLKVYFAEQRIKEVQRVEPILFFYYLLKTFELLL